VNIPKPELTKIVLKSMEVHFSIDQLIEWMTPFMQIVCRKVSEITVHKADTLSRREYELNYMKIMT
jgi:hypothetical protein